MSISAKIASLENAGKLNRYMPQGGLVPRRRLYLTVSGMADLTDPSSATNILVGRGEIEAALTRWAAGDRIYGTRRKGMFLDRLSAPPPEIWEIRVTAPSVQARLFGRFPEPNTLILTNFHTRDFLGKRGSVNWMVAMEECKDEWEQIFSGNPFSASTIREYVKENCDDFPLR